VGVKRGAVRLDQAAKRVGVAAASPFQQALFLRGGGGGDAHLTN
jgi:hypothetical protein